ncbi:MAG TPA: hypothetical protein VNA12_04910 [Mycobacteriales bacterium]|nr:hypothetical protein [Mycobacteriales bacterium]
MLRPRRSSFLRAGIAVSALCLTAACGTTVPTRAGAPGDPAIGQVDQAEGLSAPVGADPGGAPLPGQPANGGTMGGFAPGTSTSGSGGDSGSSSGQPGTAPRTASGSSGGTVTRPGGSSSAVGPGITADKVYFGTLYYPDAAVANAGLGAEGASVPDQREFYDAVIEDVNKRGGILGRKLEPLYYEFRATSNQPADAQYQAACDHWTKDNKVFAIVWRGRIMQECAMKAGTLALSGDGEAGPTYARVPNLVDPSHVRLERLGRATVSGLDRDKYFAPTPEWPTGRVGLLTWDDPSYKFGITDGYLPGLKALSIKPAIDTRYIAPAQTLNAITDASAAVGSAVLAFKSAQVDHVLIQDGSAGLFGMGGLTLLFLQHAEQQDYYPRYGFNANNVPGFEIYPPAQQHGMLAVDFSDYTPRHDEGIAPNPARERCFKIMRENGISLSGTNAMATAAGACDGVWFLETLLERATAPTLRGALDAATSLGTSYVSPNVYGTRLAPNKRDGGELARNAKFDDACRCMRYTTKPYAP